MSATTIQVAFHLIDYLLHRPLEQSMRSTRVKLFTTIAASLMLLGTAGTAVAQTMKQGVLTVGSDQTNAPYSYRDQNGQAAGFDAELSKALATQLHLKVDVVDTRFENLILGINSNKFDLIASSLFVKPERAKLIDFIPYAKTGVSIAVRKDDTFAPEDFTGLCGKRVSSITGAAWIGDLQKISDQQCGKRGAIDVRLFPTGPEATQALLAHGVDAQVDDAAVLNSAVEHTQRIRISTHTPLLPIVLGLGLKKNNTALKSELETALSQLRANGQYQALLKRYNLAEPTDGEFKAAAGL